MRLISYALTLPATAFLVCMALAAPSPLHVFLLAAACLVTGAHLGLDLSLWLQARAERLADARD